MIGVLEGKRKQISEVCSRHGVARLHVFGSALKADCKPDESDLDLLVEFLPMEPYSRVEAYFGLLEALRSLLNMKIDLVMAGAVKNPYIAREIERTKEVFYAA
jgi:hypothetical protein